MASFLSNIFASRSSKSIRVPAVKTHDIEDAVEKPARALKHLLKLNHHSNSLRILEGTAGLKTSHNNVAHHLTSAFLFGANDTDLNHLYEVDSKLLEPWKDAPGEVIGSDWMDYLGKQEYERAFLDFFEDTLVDEVYYDWKAVVQRFFFSGKQPFISSITAGFGQPLIHLGLAFQMSSRDLAMEALTLVSTHYHDNDIFKYSDGPVYFQAESSYKTSSILTILERVRTDQKLNNTAFAMPGEHNLDLVFRDHEAALLDHCNAWTISTDGDATAHFRESQTAAVALFLGATSKSENSKIKHDIYLLFPLLMSHAIRVILPQTPDRVHIPLLQQWWLTTLAIYIAQLRPEIDGSDGYSVITAYDVQGKDWQWIAQQAVKGPHALDSHFVQTLHVLKELGETWDDDPDNYYLKAAVKFVDEFNGWGNI